MLFDLQGKRRRLVQGTYLMLAVLMGGGLVLFGIGGEVSGGLFDAFSDRSSSTGNDVVEKRIERNEERVRKNPKALQPRKDLVRDYYSVAGGLMSEGATSFPSEAKDELRKAALNWQAYLKQESDDPDPVVARYALQVFDPIALDRPKEALAAARIIAADGNDAGSYLLLYQYALLAEDKRVSELASQKALSLAPEKRRRALKKQMDEIRSAVISQQVQSGDIDVQGASPEQQP
jgi:hypothetical protein